jgi:predicted O-linked N-acetylglucosamine transferase (SPINDLY family)
MLKSLFHRLLGRKPGGGATLAQGIAALEKGEAGQAMAIAEDLCGASATSAGGQYLRGLVLEHRGASAEAIAALRLACTLSPQEGVLHLKLAQVLEACGEHAASAQAYEAAFAAADAPFANDAVVHFSAAGAQFHAGNPANAIAHLLLAVDLKPDFIEAHVNLSRLLQLDGALEEATAHLDRALQLHPTAALRLRRALMLPAVFRSREHIAQSRAEIDGRLDALLLDPPYRLEDPAAGTATAPFLIAYHGEADKPLMTKLGRVVRKGLGPAGSPPPGPAGGGKIAVGIISGSLYHHSVGRTVIELVKRMDRRRFRVAVFSMAPRADALAAAFAAAADHYAQLPKSTAALRQAVGQQPCDILLYPDIGLDPETYFLAFERLAPVQCAMAGHPVTTGIDSVDYFLSGDAEPEDAASHYSEKLLPMPGFLLSLCDPPPCRTGPPAAGAGTARYVVPQTIVKLHPDFDHMLAAVLAADRHGEVCLYQSGSARVDEQVKARLAESLGENYSRLRFLPRQDYREYLDTVASCHAVLDTRHFGGGNTTLEALASGVPVVTWPGAFLRGRFALDCCSRLELPECVADSVEDFAQRAVHVARDPALRTEVLGKIHSRREALFRHQALAEGLQQALLDIASRGNP